MRTYLIFPAVRVEFLKCRARSMRWKEEVELLEEEMRRTLAFFKYKMEWWFSKQASTIGGEGADYDEGFSAYALSQVTVYHTLRRDCLQQWDGARAAGWKKPKKGKKGQEEVAISGMSEPGPGQEREGGQTGGLPAPTASSSALGYSAETGEEEDVDPYDDYD